ncbi:hypothetical protein AAC387_Pa01g1959 [Persea americana]
MSAMHADGPFSCLGEKFLNRISKVDRNLVSSSTFLVYYWIIERHNTWWVMKQFGLMQLVPPPFNMQITRRERTFRLVIDYSKKMDKDVEALWDAKSELGLQSAEDTTPRHSEEYLL